MASFTGRIGQSALFAASWGHSPDALAEGPSLPGGPSFCHHISWFAVRAFGTRCSPFLGEFVARCAPERCAPNHREIAVRTCGGQGTVFQIFMIRKRCCRYLSGSSVQDTPFRADRCGSRPHNAAFQAAAPTALHCFPLGCTCLFAERQGTRIRDDELPP